MTTATELIGTLVDDWRTEVAAEGGMTTVVVAKDSAQDLPHAVPLGSLEGAFAFLAIATVPPIEWLALVGPVNWAERHGDDDTPFDPDGPNTSLGLSVTVVTDDAVVTQIFTQPLLEPAIDPLDSPDGPLIDALRWSYEALNRRIPGMFDGT